MAIWCLLSLCALVAVTSSTVLVPVGGVGGAIEKRVKLPNGLEKLVAGDLESDARFGHGISLSSDGTMALIGAYWKDEAGLSNAGAAYFFTRPSTNSSSWTQQAKLRAGDVEEGAYFGASVSLSSDGTVALIGAYQKDENGFAGAGAAYLFTRPSSNSLAWTQQTKVRADDLEPGAHFAWSVSLSSDGTVALIGAASKIEGGLDNAGAAYIFIRSSASSSAWTQQTKMHAGFDFEEGAYFGTSVALSSDGTVALVGAHYKDESGMRDAGVAYVFTRPASTSFWRQQTKLFAGDLEVRAYFGTSVSLSSDGTVALVGAHYKDEAGFADAGAAYVFSRPSTTSDTWEQQNKLIATDLESAFYFGSSVSLSSDGTVALIGTRDKGAHTFARPSIASGAWSQIAKLLAGDGSDVENGAHFGNRVSLSGEGIVALIGASTKDEGGLNNAGAAYPICALSPGCPLERCAPLLALAPCRTLSPTPFPPSPPPPTPTPPPPPTPRPTAHPTPLSSSQPPRPTTQSTPLSSSQSPRHQTPQTIPHDPSQTTPVPQSLFPIELTTGSDPTPPSSFSSDNVTNPQSTNMVPIIIALAVGIVTALLVLSAVFLVCKKRSHSFRSTNHPPPHHPPSHDSSGTPLSRIRASSRARSGSGGLSRRATSAAVRPVVSKRSLSDSQAGSRFGSRSGSRQGSRHASIVIPGPSRKSIDRKNDVLGTAVGAAVGSPFSPLPGYSVSHPIVKSQYGRTPGNVGVYGSSPAVPKNEYGRSPGGVGVYHDRVSALVASGGELTNIDYGIPALRDPVLSKQYDGVNVRNELANARASVISNEYDELPNELQVKGQP